MGSHRTQSRSMPRGPFFCKSGRASTTRISVALPRRSGEYPCRLDIIGRLTERQRQALEDNSISYTEQWDLSDQEMIQRYRDCDMVMFASTYEGFGMPIVEGNATGRPVVTSNICSMPEVAGAAACLVDPFDCSSIRRGVLRVINDAEYRNHLISQGFEDGEAVSQRPAVAAQYAALYRKVLSHNAEIRGKRLT